MQHVLFGQKSIFLGDEAAETLIAYGAHLAQVHTGDSVALRGINAEGNAVMTTFLLNSGSDLVAESTSMDFPEPDNDDAIRYMRQRTQAFSVDPGYFDGFTARGTDGSD